MNYSSIINKDHLPFSEFLSVLYSLTNRESGYFKTSNVIKVFSVINESNSMDNKTIKTEIYSLKCAYHLQPDGPTEHCNPKVVVLDLENLGDLKNLEVASA